MKKAGDAIKRIKQFAEEWRKISYQLKGQAEEKNLNSLAAQLDLASNVAGDIASYGEKEEVEEEELDLSDVNFYLARNGDIIQGLAVTHGNNLQGDDLYIEHIITAPWNIQDVEKVSTKDFPGRMAGIGKMLVQKIISDNQKAGGDGHLKVVSADLAIGFYQKLGFTLLKDDDENLMQLSKVAASILIQKMFLR